LLQTCLQCLWADTAHFSDLLPCATPLQSSPEQLETSLDELWHHPDKGPLRPANLWWWHNDNASYIYYSYLAITWALAAWGVCCLGSRAHAALTRLEDPAAQHQALGMMLIRLQVPKLPTSSRRPVHQQPAGQQACDGSTRVLALWAWHSSERQVASLTAGAATSLLGRQLSILKRDLWIGGSPLAYLVLQVSLSVSQSVSLQPPELCFCVSWRYSLLSSLLAGAAQGLRMQ
jgi:hypothetical protein